MQLDIIKKADQIKLPENAETMKVLKGGPVDTGRGFVLHSSDFFIKDATLRIDDGICLTATVDILKAIAKGAGPKHAILALGYAGWAAGQLENEIQDNGWLHCDADPDLIFGGDVEEKYAPRAAQDRHRSRHAVERSRARVGSTRHCRACDPSTSSGLRWHSCLAIVLPTPAQSVDCDLRRVAPAHDEEVLADLYSAACCATVGSVPATVARRMSRGCDWS